jgi:CelD/BcsL family acetyltransferase involved in cellulose biosynthesis
VAETFSAERYSPPRAEMAAAGAPGDCEIVALDEVPVEAWTRLCDRAIEPNTFYRPAWARAVNAHARGRGGARVLLAWDGPSRNRLIGFLPVVSAWRALKLPFPILVSWGAYSALGTPLLDRDCADRAALQLIKAADAAGAYALLMPFLPERGAAAAAFWAALGMRGDSARVTHHEERAMLDASQDPAALLRDALGPKKLKELRRQRYRLGDGGKVSFSVAKGADTTKALEHFLALESTGWKGRRGTALAESPGDQRFIREAAAALGANGELEVAVLSRGCNPVAAGVMLRQRGRANFFKIAYDETLAKCSPGVQLTLDITGHYCADAGIREIDSTANQDHPMIDRVWRGRLAIIEMLIPVKGTTPLTASFHLAIAARRAARNALRRLYRRYRSLREK